MRQHCVLTLSQMSPKPPGPCTHPARRPRCPQNVLGQLWAVSAGFLSTPIQSRLVSLSPGCSCCTSPGGLASAPRYLSTRSQLFTFLHWVSRPQLHPYPCQREAGTRPGSPLGQVEHVVQPATHSFTFLTHPHVFTAHLLAWHCSKQACPV